MHPVQQIITSRSKGRLFCLTFSRTFFNIGKAKQEFFMSLFNIFKSKEQQYKDNCPTQVLLYLAAKRQSPHEVLPWYDKIKEYANGANFHYPEFHQAVVFGMFPELEEAAQYFNAVLGKNVKGDRARCTQAEDEVMRALHLPDTYYIGKMTKEQKQRVAQRMSPIVKKFINQEISCLNPAIQVLALALMAIIPENKQTTDFAHHFEFLNLCLESEKRFNEVGKRCVPKDIRRVATGIFYLKNQGVLDDNFRIVDYKAFKESPVVKKFCYKGKRYDLSKNLVSPSQAAKIRQQPISLTLD